jgi:enoyl-CoA hydratase
LANEVLYEKKGHVVIITLNRPEAMNSFNPPQTKAFSEASIKFKNDPDAWVAIVTGAGNKAFSAGFDLKTMDASGDRLPSPGGDAPKLIQRGLEIYKPIIAAINGFALGGGCEIAMACDFRVAADTAQLGQPEVTLGIIPGYGGTQRLPRLVGAGMAKKLLYTGDRVKADEALRIGLVEEVVPAAGLLEHCRKLALRISERGPLAISTVKKSVNFGLNVDLPAGCEYEITHFGVLCASEDQKEGCNAFLEKRKPNFTGR